MIPKYDYFRENELNEIHQHTLKILSGIGVDFSYEPALNVFRQKGLRIEGQRVYFPPEFVTEMVAKAPSSFTLHARNPEKNLVCGGDNIIFMPGYGAPFIYGPGRTKRDATMADYNNFVKLAGASDVMHMTGGNVVEPTDVPGDIRHLRMTMSHILNSDKCFMGSSTGYDNAKDTIEMAAILHGGLNVILEKPALICLIDSITPLQYDERMLGGLMAYAERGQAMVIASLVMAGSTGPVSLAGALTLQNAEVLAGICLAQCIRPGAPVVYGSASAVADMKSASLSIGNPECAIFTSASAQLARYYGIPSRGGGSLTDAKELDAQAGYESMMTLFATSISGTNCVLHAAGIFQNFMGMSYEKFVMDEEIGAMVLHYLKGMNVTPEEKFAYDAIRTVGPGGEFLTGKHTRTHFKQESFFHGVSDRRPFDLWANSYTSAEERARAKWQDALANYMPPALDSAKKEALEAFVTKRETELGKSV